MRHETGRLAVFWTLAAGHSKRRVLGHQRPASPRMERSRKIDLLALSDVLPAEDGSMPLTFEDFELAVLKGEQRKVLPRYTKAMEPLVRSCNTLLPEGVCMVTTGSPLPLMNALETLAACFVRDLRYDFRPFTAFEYSAESRSYTDKPTTDANTRSFLWYRPLAGKSGRWEAVGGCTFRLMVTMWRFQWIWFHPDERRKGRLQAAWPFFRSMFGFFVPEDPWSAGMTAFMKKNGYLEELAEFVKQRERTSTIRTLTVNGSALDMPGLGARGSYPNLSEKRITKAVRNRLRQEHEPDTKVVVSCEAKQMGNTWEGQCWLDGAEHTWKLN